MRKLILKCAWVFAIGAIAPAQAADLGPPPASSPETYKWSGPYVGANFGGAWSNGRLNIPGNNIYGGLTEFVGGAQAGYNVQSGNFVFGVEGEFDGAAFGHPTLPAATLGSVSNDWIGTIAGRLGVAEDRWLVYGKFGGALARSDATLNLGPGANFNGSHTSKGWLAGVGLEYGFKPNWTVRLEYDYLALGGWNSPTSPAIALNHDLQRITAGINYKFGNGDAPESAPKTGGGGARDEDLAKSSQNPISDLVSLPFQSNTNFNAAPYGRAQEILNIQPVVPMHITADWNMISRTIIPLVSQPDPQFDSNTNGIGDITQSLFFSPAKPGALIWGVGPVFTVPSATSPYLGTGKVLLGPTAVFLTTPGSWVIGVLLNNQWSVGGDPSRQSVNAFLAQPFVNYNMPHGWYLTSSPVMTANWLAAGDRRWTVPVGGGFGRVFKMGDQPVNASLAGYYNVLNAVGAPDWQLRASFALLFPTS